MDGYELLKPLGHKRTALYPALVQLITPPEYPRALKGVRADGSHVPVLRNGLFVLPGTEILNEPLTRGKHHE